MTKNFSVAMSVYKNDKSDEFIEAVHSIYNNQTVKPSEIILIEDGPISEKLDEAVNSICNEIPVVKLIVFPENRGHAAARQGGLSNSTNELVAIMDSDDIAEPCRFERQLEYMEKHPDVTVVGSIINEFIGNANNVVASRIVPEKDEEIKEYLRSRCPMNLQTVMYRKSKVMEVGGFIDWFCEEDYYLWVRLCLAGHKFYNIQTPLVQVRVGKEMYQRRGGMKYFLSEARLQGYMWKHNIIGIYKYLYNVLIRFIVQVILPNSIRGWVFRKFARK